MGRIEVDTAGLAAVGAQLAAEQTPATAAGCLPAAADPTSVAVAAALSAHGATLSARLAHAGANRLVGGTAVIGTAGTFDAQTAAESATWAAVEAGASLPASAPVVPPPVPATDAIPEVPAIPPIPAVAAGMPGSVWSSLIHGGPGAQPLRALADQLRATAAQARELAAQTHQHGQGIDAAWQDASVGDQQAGANTARLASWYREVAEYAESVADQAETAGGHVDTARAQTPVPEDFSKAQQRLADAWRHYSSTGDPTPVSAAVAHLGQLETTSMEQQATYAAAGQTFTTALPAPPPTPPSITEDGGNIPPENKTDDDAGADELDSDDGEQPADEEKEVKPGPTAGSRENDTGAVGPTDDDPAAAGVPPADDDLAVDPAAAPPADSPSPTAPAAANPAGPPAEMLGSLLGQGLGQAGQLGQSMPSGGVPSSLASPLSALSGLGPSEMPSPEDMGLDGLDDAGLSDPFDFGPGPTGPSSSGGPPGMSPGPLPPGPSNPAASIGASPPVTGALPSSAPAAQQPGLGMGRGGMMFPPMMGGLGGNQGAERDKSGDKRVVHKEVPNTEPVFGELERQRQRRPRATQKESTDESDTP